MREITKEKEIQIEIIFDTFFRANKERDDTDLLYNLFYNTV